MEIGSFIELQMPGGMEYYSGNQWNGMDVVRLNTGRAAIWHAFRITGCQAIWLPLYQCETVRGFLARKGVACKYYHIDEQFNPIDLCPGEKECVLFVNYYGIMSKSRMQQLADGYAHVIIDNSQAFFAEPLKNCLNVYSARKFVGVPDGAYVIGKGACNNIQEYEQGFSSDTSLFLLQRIEYGCEGKAYLSRSENEERIDSEDCLQMSKLTYVLLDGINYKAVQEKRKKNFICAQTLFCKCNRLNVLQYYDDTCVPMVYPLLIENDNLFLKLIKAKHFQGHWWKWVEESEESNDFEKWISRYMIPITIDQRYGEDALLYLWKVVEECDGYKESFAVGADGFGP